MDEARATPIVDSSETRGSSMIPHCRDDFTVDEACRFIDELGLLFQSLGDLSNLVNLYRTARQLSRTFTMCREIRFELAQHMNQTGVPRMLSRLIKRLNNVGVFSNDGTWFSSFYLYSVVWNYTDIDDKFSTAMGVAGICQLLNLNIGHPPYLENINSKNVYFLVKASLSILHNIIKVPGNRDMGQYLVGRDALLSLLTLENEDSLRCFAVLCLAHVLNEDEVHLANSKESGRPNLLQYLLGQLCSASTSVKRKNHGLSMVDILTALGVFALHESVQPGILSMDVEKIAKPGKPPNQSMQPVNCLTFLTKLTDVYLSPDSTKEAHREANAAIRIIYHLLFNRSLVGKSKVVSCMKHLLDLSRYPTVLERADKSLIRVLENMIWQTTQPPCPTQFLDFKLPDASQCGPVVMSYSPINRMAVAYFVQQLRAAGIPLGNDTEDLIIDQESAQDTGLSGLAASVVDHKSWLQSLNQATVLIACLSDAYRLNPGCRAELEYFVTANSDLQPKVLIYIVLPPKFRINGWISRMPDIDDSIDFTHKRTFINNLQVLVSRAGKPYGIMVADEQLEPLSFDFEGQKGYISIEDLQGLKSSSIFLTSSDSEPSRRSVITHTAEQMVSKGGPRLGTPMLPERRSSESLTMTPVHSFESDDRKNTELPPVASVPSTNLSESLADDHSDRELIRVSTPHSPKALDIIQEGDKVRFDDRPNVDSESSVPNTQASQNIIEAKHASAADQALPTAGVVNEDSRQEEATSKNTGDIDTRRTEASEIVSKIHIQDVNSIELESRHTDLSQVKTQSVEVEDHAQSQVASAQRMESVSSAARLNGRVSVQEEVIQKTDVSNMKAASISAQTFSEAGRSRELESKRSDVRTLEAASYRGQSLSEVSKIQEVPSKQSDLSQQQAAAASLVQTLSEAGKSQDISTKRSNISQVDTIQSQQPETDYSLGPSAIGTIKTENSEVQTIEGSIVSKSELEGTRLGDMASVSHISASTDAQSRGLLQAKSSPVYSSSAADDHKQTPSPVGVLTNERDGRTTHMHMIKEPPRLSPRATQEDSADTQSATPETIEKQTVSMDLSKTLSSLNARRSTDKRPRAARDSSVQTLSVFPDIKTLRTTEFSVNAPMELDRINHLLMMQGHYFQDPLNPLGRMLDLNDLVQPYVREWTEDQVDEWLNSKGLPQLSHRLCGHMNGVVLSQLVYLRHWAPEYFAKSVRSELGLGFVEGLRFVEALEELKKKN